MGNCDCGDGSSNKQGIVATGEPINPGAGNEHESETDYRSGDGLLVLTRHYDSLSSFSGYNGNQWQNNFQGRSVFPTYAVQQPTLTVSSPYSDPGTACTSGATDLGLGSATWNGSTCQLGSGGTLPIYSTFPTSAYPGMVAPMSAMRADGTVYSFQCTPASCTASSDISVQLVPTGSGFQVIDSNDTVENYSAFGALQSIAYRGGYAQTLTYAGGSVYWSGWLSSVTDSFGRTLTFNYPSANSISPLASVTLPDGSQVQYTYDNNGNLLTVEYPDSSTRQYSYNQVGTTYLLAAIFDESGNQYAGFGYDGNNRANASTFAGGVGAVGINYSNPTAPVVTDAFGTQRTYNFTTINGRQKISSISGPVCFDCGSEAATTYDSAGYYQSMTDWNGNVTRYSYDDTRGLELSRTEGYGSAQARTISTTWNPSFHLPGEIDEPGRKTVFTYDGSGNLLTRTVTDTASGAASAWTYSNYTAFGQPGTIKDPMSNATQLVYYPVAPGSTSGQLHTVTDALGHVTTFNSYDANARPLTVTDPNGLQITLTYTPRGYIHTVQAGSQLTSYSYYPTGLLQQVSYPSGASLTYDYNAAHQLTDIYDQLNNHIHYTPDAMGNNTSVSVYNSGGTLVQSHQSQYNTLNELYQDIGAYNGEVTQYAYDSNGNLQTTTDPLSHVTTQYYDALNRLYKINDPASNNTTLTLNALDQLTGVSDPRGLNTSYTVNALGNVAQIASPDSGTTAKTYDAGGNLRTSKDAKNQTTTYTYDALNRLATLTRQDGSEAVYTWDQNDSAHGYGIGRLTHLTDSASSSIIDFKYDINGNLLSKTEAIGGVNLVASYTYDATTGHLLTETRPSGKQLSYTWTSGQVTGISLGSASLISSIVYQPFGSPISWALGNGETDTRSYDLDGRIASDPVETLTFNAGSLISGWSLGNNSAVTGSQSFGYDALNRVTSNSGSSDATVSYQYDANGNMTSSSVNGTNVTWTVSPNSNQISGSGSNALSYDANGSLLSKNGSSFGYDAVNRLATYSTQTYSYDALGQRVKKVISGGSTTLFGYDGSAHLTGEYLTNGSLLEETVYLGDMPFAVLEPSTTYYVHADYRNAPRQIDNAAKQAVWEWLKVSPYGDSAPELQTLQYNLRYPGVYADSPGGPSYDSARSYVATIGRFAQSDPMGLVGGVNTYAYAGGNPVSYVDPLGLFQVIAPNICANQATFAAANACLQGPNNQALQQRVQDLQALGNWLQRAISKSTDCDCKKKFQQLYDNWTVRPTLRDAPGSYAAYTTLQFTNHAVTGGDSTFYNEAWTFGDKFYGPLDAFTHEFAHMTPGVSSIPGLGINDENERAARLEGDFLAQALLNGRSLCP